MNMSGGFLDDDISMGRDSASGQKVKERGGLIPITAKILSDCVVNQDENIEYCGNNLSDVCVVGYLKDYVESDTKVRIKIWDQSGIIDTVFYNKNESETHSGLSNFIYTE